MLCTFIVEELLKSALGVRF